MSQESRDTSLRATIRDRKRKRSGRVTGGRGGGGGLERWREGGGWEFKDERVRVTTLSGMPLSA